MAVAGSIVLNMIARTESIVRGIQQTKRNLRILRKETQKTIAAIARVGSRAVLGGFNLLRNVLSNIIRLSKIVVVSLIGIGVYSVKVAMEAEETANLFRESFGGMADAAQDWVRQYSTSMGVFEADTQRAIGTFNVMFKSMGMSANQAFEMSKSLTMLANDMASFYNLKPEQAFLKLQAGITGETEPLKRLGILVTKNFIDQTEYAKAILATGRELTELEKVYARFYAIMNQTRNAQGDMQRTMNSTTNVFRVLWAQVKTAAYNIGQVFLPLVNRVAISLRDWFINNQYQIVNWATAIRNNLIVAVQWIEYLMRLGESGQWRQIFVEIGNVIGAALRNIVAWIQNITPKAKDIGKDIGEGIWAYLKDTDFGHFLSITGKTAKLGLGTLENATQLGLLAKLVGYGSGVASGGQSARLNPNVERREELQELRRMNEQMKKLNNRLIGQ